MSTSPILDPQELVVYIDQKLNYCEYHGTRTQLEGEGVIPANMQWPEGYSRCYWDEGPFTFGLVRMRPEGAKGPRRQFYDCDWWHLRWEYSDRSEISGMEIRRESQALARLIRRHSPKGQAELARAASRFVAARCDEDFQAFKAGLPGLVPPRRGRRVSEQGAIREGGRS